DGIEYTITSLTNPTTVEVSDYVGISTTVVIPTTVTNNGITYTVTAVGSFAFWDNSLTSVTIPDSIISIVAGAFANNNLTSVTIPSSVTTIGGYAFGDNNLRTVISESLDPATLL
ncbi:leucine-rich repeat domain-containing protein, partial [Aquimarina pacifica]|uniref:leucine-rich repeat domain-containing protein n=1 Tax=Aquimarina pacifica TaxID=1296415 RepID=UPI00046EBCF8